MMMSDHWRAIQDRPGCPVWYKQSGEDRKKGKRVFLGFDVYAMLTELKDLYLTMQISGAWTTDLMSVSADYIKTVRNSDGTEVR